MHPIFILTVYGNSSAYGNSNFQLEKGRQFLINSQLEDGGWGQ